MMRGRLSLGCRLIETSSSYPIWPANQFDSFIQFIKSNLREELNFWRNFADNRPTEAVFMRSRVYEVNSGRHQTDQQTSRFNGPGTLDKLTTTFDNEGTYLQFLYVLRREKRPSKKFLLKLWHYKRCCLVASPLNNWSVKLYVCTGLVGTQTSKKHCQNENATTRSQWYKITGYPNERKEWIYETTPCIALYVDGCSIGCTEVIRVTTLSCTFYSLFGLLGARIEDYSV